MKKIQSLFVPIKPNEDSDHDQVGTWTQECIGWNRTTENQISLGLAFLDEVKFDILWLAKFWFAYDLFDKKSNC